MNEFCDMLLVLSTLPKLDLIEPIIYWIMFSDDFFRFDIFFFLLNSYFPVARKKIPRVFILSEFQENFDSFYYEKHLAVSITKFTGKIFDIVLVGKKFCFFVWFSERYNNQSQLERGKKII